MIQIHGKSAAPGVAFGPLYFYKSESVPISHKKIKDPLAEWQRYLVARDLAVSQLGALAEKARIQGGDTAALVFETHQLMVEDEDFEQRIREDIFENLNNASSAVCNASSYYQTMFNNMDGLYMKARAIDMRDIARRLNDILLGRIRGTLHTEVPVILVADDLTPSDTIQLDKNMVLGFVTSQGSPAGHTAILARSLGIPAVVEVGDLLKRRNRGREAAIDGDAGLVIVNPDHRTRERLEQKQAQQAHRRELLTRLKGKENITQDGRAVSLVCNITTPEDLEAVKENDGGGVGLFRSEFLYLRQNDYPSEEDQFLAYREAALQMRGKSVIIRTLDIGADKQAGYFNMEPEPNPAMGMRALRLCLTRPGVFRTQLRAIYRASAFGKLAIMFPIVTAVWELREARKMCQIVMAELEQEGIPYDKNVPLGIMIETPAAVFISDRLAHECDFFSIGTNDLLQYTTACDRQTSGVSRFYDPHHPALLRAIKMVVDSAHAAGIWVGVCGELASDLSMVQTLLALGVDELSVSPGSVLEVRDIIRKTNVSAIRGECVEEIFRDTEREETGEDAGMDTWFASDY